MRGKDAVRALLESPEPGTHAILWLDDSEDGDGAILAFLRGAIRRSDLTLIVLPHSDLDALTDRMRAHGIDFDALVDQGHLVRAAFEDIAPHRVSDLASSQRDLEALREFARSVGKKGLSIIGRTAPIYFENGEGAMAAAVEEAAHEARGDARILCLYNARSLRADRFADALAVTRMHTHAITALGGGRFFVESVQRPLVFA